MLTARGALLAAAVALLGVLAGAVGTGAGWAQPSDTRPVYLALGDSLTVGVQPDAAGVARPTPAGYPPILLRTVRSYYPTAHLVVLGCPGERAVQLAGADRCHGAVGQLRTALTFLRTHRNVVAVTLDIGINDVVLCPPPISPSNGCDRTGLAGVRRTLPTVLTRLRAADRGRLPLIGYTYYDPYLATADAAGSRAVFVALNGILRSAYASFNVPVASMGPAFGLAAGDAAAVCRLTWMCARGPRGPNLHPDADGYRAIASAAQPALRALLTRSRRPVAR